MGPLILVWATLLGPGEVRVEEDEAVFEGLRERAGAKILRIDDPGRTLRGDFEPPAEVALVYTRAWPELTRRMANALAVTTPVFVLREDDTNVREVRQWWRSLDPKVRDEVELVDLKVSSPWVRDYGPFQVRKRGGERIWVDAGYDELRTDDDALPARLSSRRPSTVEQYPDWIEGGAFISNGAGLCAAVVDYFDLRGPSVADDAGMSALQRLLGCRVLVLVPSLDTEPTHHVDMVAQFVSPTKLLLASADDEGSDRRVLLEVETALREAAASLGTALEVTPVPVRYSRSGMFRSYVNGLFVPGVFLMPEYGKGDRLDVRAREAIAAALPGVEVLPLPASRPASNGGALHCLTLGLDAADRGAPLPEAPGSKQ